MLSLGCGALLLLAGLSPYINPAVLSWLGYLGLVFPYLLLLNLLWVLFWLCIRKSWFLFHLVCLLLVLPSIKRTVVITKKAPTKAEATELKVLSYNTMCMGSFTKPTKGKQNDILSYILEQDADIVCLQEFGVHKNSKYLTLADVNGTLKGYPHRHIQFKVNNDYQQIGVAIYSKYPIVRSTLVEYDSQFNLSIYSDVVVKEDTIRVVNNHLESNRLTEKDILAPSEIQKNISAKAIGGFADLITNKLLLAYKFRAVQAQKVAAVVQESPYPTIVCGDFNDVPTSYTYHTIGRGLKDAFVEQGNAGFGNSYTKSWLRVRIDYILFHPRWECVAYQKGTTRASDHYPISAVIRLVK